MPENLMNSNHKAVSDRYRDGWDRIWGESIPMRIKRITLAIDRAILELVDKKETPLLASGGGE